MPVFAEGCFDFTAITQKTPDFSGGLCDLCGLKELTVNRSDLLPKKPSDV